MRYFSFTLAGFILISVLLSVCSAEVPTEPISLDSDNVDVRSVLNLIQAKTGLNLVVHGDVRGNISVKVDRIMPVQALKMICSLYGFSYSEIDGIHVIGSPGVSRRTDFFELTRIFSINNCSAQAVSDRLKDILKDSRFGISPDPRTNRLIVQAEEVLMRKIETLISQLDVRIPSVVIEAKFYSSKSDRLKETGFIWEWDPIEVNEQFPAAGHGLSGCGLTDAGEFTRSPLRVTGTLNAKESGHRGNLITVQRIMVESNSWGSINVGDKIIYGGGPDTPPQEKDSGIIMRVRPVILGQNTVQVSLELEVSSIVSYAEGYPVIAQQKTESKNVIPFGIEVPVGGVTGDGNTSDVTGIPFLSETPVISGLLRNTSSGNNRKVILITIKAEKVSMK